MKLFTFLSVFLFVFSSQAYSAQITVSNDPESPAMYSSLQTAVTAAAPGDTLLIAPSKLNSSGSPISYGTVNMYVNLVLIGGGSHFPGGATTSTEKKVTKLDNIYLYETSASSGSSNSKIIGISVSGIYLYAGFSGSTLITGGLKNVLIERCEVNYISFNNNGYHGTYQNDTIRNCIIKTSIDMNNYIPSSYSTYYDAISIENNIFDGSAINGQYNLNSNGSSLDSVFVRNNIFLNRTSYIFNEIPHMVIENNIFWKAEPLVNNTPNGATFNNNLCYSTTATLPGTGNTGSGNINNSNPLFMSYPAQGAAFSCTHDYTLASSSPAKNAGTDNSDIGVTGGISPFDNICGGPKVPTIKYITMPTNASSVPQGGTLNVTFKAKNRD
jgi:hypothetical protein